MARSRWMVRSSSGMEQEMPQLTGRPAICTVADTSFGMQVPGNEGVLSNYHK